MLSSRLVQCIERDSEEIAARLARAVRTNPNLKHLSQLPDIEIREWAQEILGQLSYLLEASSRDEVRRRFEALGKDRRQEQVPLSEAVLRLQILEKTIIGFIHDQGFPMTGLQLYAEEELLQRMGRFFDSSIYHLVRGYEDAEQLAKRLAS
jgi:hypothetical protein